MVYKIEELYSLILGLPVYEGMIVGEHNRENDLVVNVCKTKKLTNMRAAGSDDVIRLSTPRKFTL